VKPFVSARQAARVLRRETDDLRESDRRDREVIGAQAQGGKADENAEDDCDRDRGRQREPERPLRLHGQDHHRVGADRHEADLAEVDDPGVADVELQPEREDRVDAGEHADARPEAGRRQEVESDREREMKHRGRRFC
jgi:hypothetical protein